MNSKDHRTYGCVSGYSGPWLGLSNTFPGLNWHESSVKQTSLSREDELVGVTSMTQ